MADFGTSAPAHDVLQLRLTVLAGRLPEAVELAREDRDDGVHRVRTTCRRLRAVLATYRPLVDREQVEPVRDELPWLARALADEADRAGKPTVTWRRLHTREEGAARAVEAELHRLWHGVVSDRTDGWLR